MRQLFALFLVLALALPGLAQDQGIRLLVTLPNASPEELARFRNELSQEEMARLFAGLPSEQRGKVRAIALANANEGILLNLSVDGSPDDARAIAQTLAQPIADEAAKVRPASLQISAYRVQIQDPYSLRAKAYWPWAAGLGVLLLVALAVAWRLRKPLPLPRLMGVPLLGTLANDMLYLNSEPCLALGAMFLMATQGAKRGEVVVYTKNGQGIIPACLAKSLAKEGHRVLIVDRFGEKGNLAQVFAPGQEGEGAGHALDILSMPHKTMSLPTTLRENYDWILYFSREMIPHKPTVAVLDRGPLPWAIFTTQCLAVLSHTPLLGVALVGLRPSEKVMARYHLHYNFERLRRLERG